MTPGEASICRKRLASICVAALVIAVMGSAAQAEPIRGAGSTLAAPIIAKWASAYKNARADGGDFFTLDWTVDYEPVGSLAGLTRLNQPELDLAAYRLMRPKQGQVIQGGVHPPVGLRRV